MTRSVEMTHLEEDRERSFAEAEERLGRAADRIEALLTLLTLLSRLGLPRGHVRLLDLKV